ncbi:DUF5947 family protein [Actinospica robiniae]|uniref:DUF5947 family protein n=1 Tax=Actinospica robiniae TaxID=304901 RepID=UPI0003F5B14A|nr:DUF5947 family protein [Actinospica robiniae]
MTAVAAEATTALARAIRRPPVRDEAEERCDVCGVALSPTHRHLVDGQSGELQCACPACTVLFQRDASAAAGPPGTVGRFRLVPTRREQLPELPVDELAELGLPVGLAFIVAHPDGTALAHYPSPAGATRWDLDAADWRRVTERCPPLAALEPEVQALLLNTARGRHDHWIVPIDDCYRLVALIRREWRGLSGGTAVWPAIAGFFADLGERKDHG